MKARVVALVVLVAGVVLTTVAAASPAFTAGASLPSYRLATSQHIGHGWFPSKGKRGSFTIDVRVRDAGTLPIKRIRSWRFSSFDTPLTGQYAQVTGGGRRIVGGGHQAASYTRLFGRVSRPGGAKQRVLITFKGRPKGVFVVRPLEPGVLKRDSGTYHFFGTG
jgi:hypothetical protein